MSTLKLTTIIGARPQFIKAATVSRVITNKTYVGSDHTPIKEFIIHTGQHYDQNMSATFFDEMSIPAPSHHLGIGGSSHGQMTGQMLEKIEKTLLEINPDIVLVYGDTNSTLAGALAAAKLGIKIAHVEAGLRSFNYGMPEEINRVLTDQVSHWLFCPTDTAVSNLTGEGFGGETVLKRSTKPVIKNCGDVMYDALMFYRSQAKPSDYLKSVLNGVTGEKFILMTLHRAENTDNSDNLSSILATLNDIRDFKVIFPVHPRTKKMISKLGITHTNIIMTEPVGYFDMICLLDRCALVATDSGGLQKEAYFMARPCITLREETEWLELITAGANILTGADPAKIREAIHTVKMGVSSDIFQKNLYGSGHAAKEIVESLINEKVTD